MGEKIEDNNSNTEEFSSGDAVSDECLPNAQEAPVESVPDQIAEPKPRKIIQAQARRRPTALRITVQALGTTFLAAFIVATLFSVWLPGTTVAEHLEPEVISALAMPTQSRIRDTLAAEEPRRWPSNRIGIVIGHRAYNEGFTCGGELTELAVNTEVATYLQQKLLKEGYEVVMLDEFDLALSGFEANALVSIHTDTCDYINDTATGFKVAAVMAQRDQAEAERLAACIADRYAQVTKMQYHYQSVTNDMSYLHAFSEINPHTPAAVIELGFLNLDQQILKNNPEELAEGVFQGIQCFMLDEAISTAETPVLPETSGTPRP
jgi:N-acetylmuramoyl-L-alanine amidase